MSYLFTCIEHNNSGHGMVWFNTSAKCSVLDRDNICKELDTLRYLQDSKNWCFF